MKFILAAYLLLGPVLCRAQFYSPEEKDQNKLDAFIEQTMKRDSIPGLAAVILINKKPVWMKGYGYADKENKIPFTLHTVMPIASISKTFTGVCVMKAVEDRLVSLDEDINTYLPFKVINPFYPEVPITLRTLGTHTSGIIDREPYITTYHFGGDPSEPLGEWLKGYLTSEAKHYKKENFTDALPGSRYEYSNIGAALAGYIVECVTGELLNRYSKRTIFDPLKMDDSGWLLSEIDPAKHAKLYYKQGDSSVAIEPYGLVTYPDGGARTSAADLSTYFTYMLNRGAADIGILKEESIRTMTTPQFTSSHKPKNINLKHENSGIFWSFENNNEKSGHDGGDPGVDTEMFYDHKKQIGIILFVNISSDDEREEEEIKGIPEISKELWREAVRMRRKQYGK
jgi:CubicO group peptidase (beta-lactamase class C family)